MGTYYSPPFKLHFVKDPRTGKRRQFMEKDKEKAEALARSVVLETGAKLKDVLWQSRTFYSRERTRGRSTRLISTGQSTKYSAQRWCKKREQEALGPLRILRKPLKEAVKEWIDELEAKGRRPKTIRDYRIQTKFWVQILPGKFAGELRHKDLTEFNRKRGGGARLHNLNVTLWRSFSKWCLRHGYMETDPTSGLERRSEPKREPRVLSEEEIGRLLHASRDEYKIEGIKGKRNVGGTEGGASKEVEEDWSQTFYPPEELCGVVLLALTSLLRLHNCLDLRWRDLDVEELMIRLPAERTKQNADLVIPMAKGFRSWLSTRTKGEPNDLVFGVTEIKKPFSSALKRAKIKGATFHCLRKTGATYLLQNGTPFEVVMRLGGWSTGKNVLLNHYRAISTDELREAVNRLDSLLARLGGPAVDKATKKVNTGA